MKIDDKIAKAKDLGRMAFKQGAMAVPALDMDLAKLLLNIPANDDAIRILNAWVEGWHEANLADEGN